MTLFWQQMRAQFMGLLIWTGAGLLLVLGLAGSAAAAGAEGGAMFEKLPPELQRMMGYQEGLSTLDLFVSGKAAVSMALILVLYGIVLALSVVTREVDRRTIDFLLSLPVSRSQVLLTRTAVMVMNTGILGGILWGAFIASMNRQGLEPLPAYWLIFLAQWLLAVMIGGITLLVSLWIDDYSLAIKIFIGLLSALYFLDLMLKAAGVDRIGRILSPFSYADPVPIILEGALPWSDTLLMIGVALLTIGASVPVFNRKQISA